MLPKHAVVINTSRGSTIDDDALIDALQNKKIYAAGLDVFNNEPNLDKRYLKLDNCFVLPHIGSATHETRLAMSMMAVNNIHCYFNKKPRVYIYNIDTGQQEVLGDFPGMTFAPRFSPDGNQVIMSLALNGNSDIFTMDLGESTKKQYTTT